MGATSFAGARGALFALANLSFGASVVLYNAFLPEIASEALDATVVNMRFVKPLDADLVRRLQQYERYKKAALDIDTLPRQERDVWQASADLRDRPAVRTLPQIDLQEMLLAFRDVALRAQMFSHHHVKREPLSVRERMSDVLAALEAGEFVDFVQLFRPEEGRMGVTVTFVAILELMRETLIDIVQTEPMAPLHVRRAGPVRTLHLVPESEPSEPQESVP